MVNGKKLIERGLVFCCCLLLVACAPEGGGGGAANTSSAPGLSDAIYVSSGTTYAGNGIAMTAPSNIISKFSTDGVFLGIIRDYSTSPGDSPTGMVNYDANNLLVLVDNSSGRRLEIVPKDGSAPYTFLTNSTALSAQVRAIAATPDGGFLVSKGTAIEKFNNSKARVTSGANPFISAPGGVCATSTTLIPSIAIGASGNIFMAHAAASANNQFNLIKATGYGAVGDCLASQDGPSTTAYPTAMLYHSTGKLLVAYGNNTGPVNQINSYAVTATTIGATVVAFANSSILQGITAMTETSNSDVLVAAGASTFNTIERFTFDASTGALTRAGTTAFITPSIYSRSVSAIVYDVQ